MMIKVCLRQKPFNIRYNGLFMAGKPKHVLMLLTNPFRPDPRVHKEARSLTEAGYKVSIIAWDRDMASPEEEVVDGISIKRFGPESGYDSFFDHLINLPRFWMRSISHAKKMDIDIVHAHDLDTLLPGVMIRRRKKIPLVYDAHESYSRMISGSSPSMWLIKLIDRVERWLSSKADLIITVNDRLKKMLEPSGKDPIVVMNCPVLPDATQYDPQKIRKEMGIGDQFVIIYIGVLEKDRFLLESINAMKGSKDKDILLLIGGYGTLEDEIKKNSEGMANVRFLGRIPADKVMPYTAASDMVLCMFNPADLNNQIGTPNKLFEAMANGKPIIVTKGILSGDIVTGEKVGLAVGYSEKDFLKGVDRISNDKAILSQMQASGWQAAEARYNWKEMSNRLVEAYSEL